MEKQKYHKRVKLSKVHPNKWNPNEMDDEFFQKLVKNIKVTLEQAGEIPPIVVRTHPKRAKHYEIIDGEHRWRALKELGEERVPIFIIEVDDRHARVMTNTLNWLRGEPDREKYVEGIAEMVRLGATVNDLAELLPESYEDLEALIEEGDIQIEEDIRLPEELDEYHNAGSGGGGGPSGGEGGDDTWVTLTFRVPVSVAEIVEGEVTRISGALRGKSKRTRALEYMAVMSSQCTIPRGVR